MNYNKCIIALLLICTGLKVNGSESQKSYWESYAPTFMQNAATKLQQQIASWSPEQKLAVAGATLASLLAIYNKDEIMDFVETNLPGYIPLQDKLDVPYSASQSLEDLQKEREEKFREVLSSPFADLSSKEKKRILDGARKCAEDVYKGVSLNDKEQFELEAIKELATQSGTIAEKFYNKMQEELLKHQTNIPENKE